jgi:thiamine transport system substrate-binding protein
MTAIFRVTVVRLAMLCALLISSVGCDAQSTKRTLTVLAVQDFAIHPTLVKQFEQDTGATLVVLKVAQAELMLSQPITADVAYGFDTWTHTRALNTDQFASYEAPALSAIPTQWVGDSQHRLLPVDVNFVTVNYDLNYFANMGWPTPTSLRDLTNQQLFHKFVLVLPDSTTIGLAFLAWTRTAMPDGSAYPWESYWRDLFRNAAHPVKTWQEAYGLQFTATQPPGTDLEVRHPLCLSFASSPAVDVQFNQRDKAVIGNVGDSGFAVVRYAGILKATQQRKLAEQFIDLLLSEAYQKDIPTELLNYPVRQGVPLPKLFAQYAPPPARPIILAPDTVEQNRAAWLEAWRKLFAVT